jgi:hypothetical protein
MLITDAGEDALDWLQVRLGLEDVQLMALVKRFPAAHTLSIADQLQPTLDWLQQRIGWTNKELGEVVLRQPRVLRVSVPEQLAPNIAWLQERLALNPEQLQRVLRYLTPVYDLNQLMGSQMEETLEPTLEWLEEKRLALANWSRPFRRYLDFVPKSFRKGQPGSKRGWIWTTRVSANWYRGCHECLV